ncbi:MAG TPA: diguanylate cyclase, partial [Herminiimonas sp.]|nr:diguanylate cyclase [Herminiimonas sp.]
MRFRSLESRIVVLFLILIMAVQVAGFAVIHTAIADNARKSTHTELEIGERVFQRLLQQNAMTLTQSARLLATDYGFRQAISTDDRETIASALQNHGARIGASIALFIGDDRQIKAATDKQSAEISSSVLKLIDQAEATGGAADIGVFEHKAYQIVVVPVKAPLTIGWVAMAFPVDQRIANDMRALSSLQVAIFVREATSNKLFSNVSTMSSQDTRDLTTQLMSMHGNAAITKPVDIRNDEFSSRILTLADDGGRQVFVVLQQSISEAIEPYRHLQMTLLILTAIGILVAAAVSFFTARRITGPLRQLAENAKRVGAGDFKGDIVIKRDDEIGELSHAFENMRVNIGNRELEIRRLAYWDTLTGLPNRAQFVILLNDAIAESTRLHASFYVLILNLDRFKNVNDVLGHGFGDALLQQVAQRLLQQIASSKDQVARLGGDEFAVLLPNTTL